MKNNFSINLLYSSIALMTVFASCKKDNNEPDANKKGSISLKFDNVVGSSNLTLNTVNYQNALGQTFNVSTFKYYVSNVVLKKSDGTSYTVPKNESYFLIDESNAASLKVTLANVPEGDYNGADFTIGVDSVKSTAPVGERTGVLDPAGLGEGMYWMWNSGYIFVKLEGTSPQAPLDTAANANVLFYHIGGFGGYSSQTINNIKSVSLSFGDDKAMVRESKSVAPEVHLAVDVLKIVNGTTNVDFSTHPIVMFNSFSTNIAANYSNMFSVEHVHND